MLYSSSCEYAIRALSYLERQAERPLIPLAEIAETEDIPAPFLGKILQSLVKAGLLRSVRGPTGGYALAQPPSEIRLLRIREILDGIADLDRCAVGLDPCEDETPCPLHEAFKPIREAIKQYLSETSLHDVVQGLRDKEAAIAARR
jgi:Rrf2 family protein